MTSFIKRYVMHRDYRLTADYVRETPMFYVVHYANVERYWPKNECVTWDIEANTTPDYITYIPSPREL